MIKKLNFFDYADNVKSSNGCAVCTQKKFEEMLDNQEVAKICHDVAEIRSRETPEMDEETRRKLKDAANKVKITDKVILFHGHSTDGRRSNEHMTSSPWCCMDIDDVENPRELYETIRSGLEALHCPLAFVSPSGRGLKFLVPMVDGMDRKEAQKYIADVLHLPSYDSTPDLARCCFMVPRANLLCYHPEMLFAEEVELLPNPNEDGSLVPYEEVAGPNIEDAQIIDEQPAEKEAVPETEPKYHGIPMSRIAKAYWIVTHNGLEPASGERNDLTYEMALNFRHICDYDRDLLLQIIPCYGGLPNEERVACIDSALKRPRTKMPAKMLNTLNYLSREERNNAEFQQFVLDVEEEDHCYYIKQIRSAFAKRSAHIPGMARKESGKLPAGLRETLDSLSDSKAMPVMLSMGAMIGVLASDIRLNARGEGAKALNLQVYVVGKSGSGKSQIDRVDYLWMRRWREKQEVEKRKQRAYEDARRAKVNAKEQPTDPKARILELSPRTSTSMQLTLLENANGEMCYTFYQEADMGSANAGQSFNRELSVIQRCAYDESPYSTQFQNKDTGCRYVEHTRWNFVKCCTMDALFRAQTNYTDGSITRLSLGRMEDNTFAPFKPMKQRSKESENAIYRYASLVALMKGDVRLSKLDEVGYEWQERIRVMSLRNDDEVMASLRVRIPTTAVRICCALMLPQLAAWLISQLDECQGELPEWAGGCTTAENYLLTHPDAVAEHLPKFQTKAWCKTMEYLCDYLIEQLIYFFGEKIKQSTAVCSTDVKHVYRTANDTIYDQLPNEFEDVDLLNLKNGQKEAARSLRRRWMDSGLIKMGSEPGRYIKVG